MNNGANIGFVDPHTEGYRRDDHIEFARLKIPLNGLAFLMGKTRVIGRDPAD